MSIHTFRAVDVIRQSYFVATWGRICVEGSELHEGKVVVILKVRGCPKLSEQHMDTMSGADASTKTKAPLEVSLSVCLYLCAFPQLLRLGT